MFKLVVLSALVACAFASGVHLGYAATPVAYASYSAPISSAVSHHDIISKPVVSTYSQAIPTAVSHQSRTDVVSKPIIATYAAAHAAPAIAKTVVAAAPIAYATYSAPIASAVSHQSRHDINSELVVASYAAYAHAAPIAYSSYASDPVVAKSYAAPALAYSAGYGYGYNGLNAINAW